MKKMFEEDEGREKENEELEELEEDEEAEEELEEVDEPEDDEEDLLILKEDKRKPKLEEEDYVARVGKPSAKKEPVGKYGPWIKVTLPFIVKNEKDNEVTVNYMANKSMHPNSRLYSTIKGILGKPPEDNFDLKELEGKKVKISIQHDEDEKGNIWDNIASIRKYRPEKKKKQ